MSITTLTKYTIDQIRDSILQSFIVYRPKDSTAVGSDAWVAANALAEQLYKLQLRDDVVASWISEQFSTGVKLDAHATQWLLEPRKAATTWVGTFELTATSGTPIVPINSLITINEITYKTTVAIAAADWSGGTVDVDCESVTTGTEANQVVGSIGLLSSPPAGVSSSCKLASTITEALDAELDASLRLRIQNAKRNRPASGNWSHYVEWTESVSGVDKAYVYPLMYGLGTVLTVPCGTSGSIVSSTIIDDVEDEINAEGHKPVGTILFVKAATESAVTCSLNVFPSVGYEADWEYDSGSPNVIAVGPAPTTTVFYTVGTPTVETGNRIIIVYDDDDGVRHTIQRIVSTVDTGTKKITITEALPNAPLVGSYLYPGSSIWQPIYDAIVGINTKLGTANCTDYRSYRFPYQNTENMNSTLYTSQIYEAVENVEGTNGVDSLTLNGSSVDYLTNEISRGATTIPILRISPYVTITFGEHSGPS